MIPSSKRSAARAAAFPDVGHNHAACLSDALDRAKSAFETKGLRLTSLRQHVFEEIAASHHAMGAYDVLARLAEKGQRLAPISIYRALDALLEAGIIHRLESKNAFFACHSRHPDDRDQLVLACDTCSRVAEVPGDAVFAAIDAAAAGVQFRTSRRVTEVTGLCADCQRQG